MNKKTKIFLWIFLWIIFLATMGCRKASRTSIIEETKEASIDKEYTEPVDCLWDANVFAWVDQNRNGIHDEGDTPLENVDFQVNDTLNELEDVSEPAISDGHGRAKLSVWLPGCPDTKFEIRVKPPDGYQSITESVIEVDSSIKMWDFGFALIDGYPSATSYAAGLTCTIYPESADDFTIDTHGTVWLVNQNGIKKLWVSTNSWDSFYVSTEYIFRGQIFVSQSDVVWINDNFLTTRIENGKPIIHSAENDLIARSIPSIGISPDGFIWFHEENRNSLAGYNPEMNSWKSFISLNGKTPALPTWTFTDGDAWRATFIDFSVIEKPKPESDKWRFYPSYIFSNVEIIDDPITGYLSYADVDQEGHVWLASDNGIAKYDSLSNTWDIFELGELFDHFSERVIVDLSTSPDGSIWVAMEGEHPLLFRYTPNSSSFGEWRRFDFRDGIPDLPRLKTIEFDKEGKLWIGFENESIIARCTELES